MTLGDRHLSDPPGAIYSSPFCLSPSYGDPTSLDAFHTDTAPKPSSSPFSMHEQPQHTNRQTSLQSQPQLHTTSHGARRAHTVHGGTAHEASEMLRLIEPSGSPYEQLFSFTDEVSYHQAQSRRSPTDHLTMRGTSPVDLMVPRGTSPVDRFGTSTGMSVGVTATQAPYHHQQHGFPAGGPQRTSSETSGLDTPLDMAFLDIPGGSPTHHTPPWTPRSSNAFNECDDPLMQPLPQLDMPPTHFQDLAFSQYADPAPQHVLHPQSQPQQQPPQHAAPPPFRVASPARGLPFRAATSLPRATSNAGSMSLSGVCGDDSALQRRTHSPALSDAGMPASGFGCSGDGGPASRINSGATAEQRPLSHIRSMPARVRVEEAATINDFHVQDTFGGTFAIHPADPPRAEVSGMSREKSLRLLHSSITGQPNESNGRGTFHPVSLNSFSQRAVPQRPEGVVVRGCHGPSHPTTRDPAPDAHTQPDMFSGNPPQQSGSGLGMHQEEADAFGGSLHSGGGRGGGAHMLGSGGSTIYNAWQTARMLQQITMPPGGSGYGDGGAPAGGPITYGVPAQPHGTFNATYLGLPPANVEAHGGMAAGAVPMGAYPQQEQVFVGGVRGGLAGGVLPAAEGMAGHAVHEGTQRGGTALRKLQNVPEGAARPVMLRAAPTGRTAARRHGGSGTGGPSSMEARAKRSAMTLSEMVAKADAGSGGSGDAQRPNDTSLHSSSKRTRTSNGTALHPSTAGADAPSEAGGQSPSMHTNLTGPMEAFGVGDGGGSTHGRSRRSRMGLDPKDEWSLEDWVNRIAREEAPGSEAAEAALRAEFLDWETRSKSAPNGKWRGANSRKWGKVGIEMRLTGSVPRTEGPVTQLGRMVCKFVDVVEADSGRGVLSAVRPGGHLGGGQTATPRVTDASGHDERQVSGASGQESGPGGLAFVDDSLSVQAPPGAYDGPGELPHWRSSGRNSITAMHNSSLRASGRSFSAMQAMEGDEKYVWRLAEIVDKQAGGIKTVLKEKVWLGTYHTPINAAVHHDFYKVVLAVEGCIFTSVDVPTCSAPTGKKKSQKLKLNFPLDDLPELMYKAVRFTQLWNKYKQDAERYVFRSFDATVVRTLVQELIDKHCVELRKHVANNDPEGTANTVERRSTRTRATNVSQRSGEISGDVTLE